MRRVRLAVIFLMLYPGLATLPAAAHPGNRPSSARLEKQKGQDKAKAKGPKGNAVGAHDELLVWRTSPNAWRDRDRCVVIVRRYYNANGLPPGLAKKPLPPGLRKQLRERGHLPPGLDRHWALLPVDLERELPLLPPHHVRRLVGFDLVVVDTRVNIIVSLWPGVFGR